MRILALVLAIGLFGCETVGSSEGIVVETGGTKPVQDARVTLACPKSSIKNIPTDANGHFHIEGMWMESPDCKVIVEKPGYATKTIPASDTCRNAGEAGCHPLPTVAIDPAK